MWVAIVEKAFAHYRKGANNYRSIEGRWGVEANRAFGSTSSGSKSIRSYSSAAAMANDMFNRWNSYQAVTIGFSGGDGKKVAAGDPIYLSHQYTVVSFQRNSAGAITGIVLRNPWGTDGNVSNDSNPNDGLVTLTPGQIYKYAGNVDWGRV